MPQKTIVQHVRICEKLPLSQSMWRLLILFVSLCLLAPFAEAQERYYLSHIANGVYPGGSYRTTFILFNNNNTSVSATLRLTNDGGASLPMGIQGLGTGSQFTFNLPAGSSRILQTDGAGALVVGAATIDSNSAPIGVSSIFTLYDTAGNYMTEAGVGGSELSSDFMFPVDVTGLFNTGIALFNPGNVTANLNVTVLGTNGQQVLTATRTLSANGHLALFLGGAGQLFPTLNNFRGTVIVQSTSPVAALVLRENAAPLSYTSLPVVPRSTTRTSLNVAHLATGSFGAGSFRTSFLIFNPTTATANGTITLTRDDGTPLTVTIPGRGTNSSFSFSLSAGASVFMDTDGLGQLTVGAASISSSTPIGAAAIFTVFGTSGSFQTEAGVGDSVAMSLATLPVDITGGGDTGVAFFNPGTTSTSLTLRLLDAGGVIAATDVSLNLPAKNHLARFVSDLFPGKSGFQGVLAVSASTPVSAITLRQNAGPSYTTLPVRFGVANGTPPTGGGTSTIPSLTSGSYWEYFWTSETENFAQGSGTTYEVKSGKFRVTLGAPSNTGGQTAHPITVSGVSSDGVTDFAPEWKFLAISPSGAILGSNDGNTFTQIFSFQSSNWTGGGFFVPFPAGQAVTSSSGTFLGEYNQVGNSLVVSRQTSSGGCTFYPSVGQTICIGDPTTISEREYYKAGVGPIGYRFESTQAFSGGGFTTSSTRTRVVELTQTSFFSSDGTVFKAPPWQEMKSMAVARTRHAAVVLSGRIYVIGGIGANNASLSSVEIYDSASDTWTSGTPLPVALSYHTAEVVGGKIYVIPSSGTIIYVFNPATNSWSTAPRSTYNDPSQDSCTMLDDYVVVATPAGAFSGGINVPFYQVSSNTWSAGSEYATSDRRWFSAACIGTDLYVVGGYMQSLSQPVNNSILKYHAVDPAGWTALPARMSEARYSSSAVAFNGEVVVMGGRNTSQSFRSIEAYNPASGTWRAFPAMFRARIDFDSVVVNGSIYVIGGKSGSTVLSQVERYTP